MWRPLELPLSDPDVAITGGSYQEANANNIFQLFSLVCLAEHHFPKSIDGLLIAVLLSRGISLAHTFRWIRDVACSFAAFDKPQKKHGPDVNNGLGVQERQLSIYEMIK